MAKTALVALGWAWPCVVALLAVVAMGQFGDVSEATFRLLLGISYIGSLPAVSWTISRWLPSEWSSGVRWGIAVAAALVVVAGLILPTLYIYFFGRAYWGYPE